MQSEWGLGEFLVCYGLYELLAYTIPLMGTAKHILSALGSKAYSSTPDGMPLLPQTKMWQLAVDALHRENEQLQTALTLGHRRFPKGYDKASRGLAYWVFETGLVYTVFKAWAPEMVTRWEHAYVENGSKATDLVLFPSETEGWAVEAKWWNSNSNRANAIVMDDVNKLRKAGDFSKMVNPLADRAPDHKWRRFVMAFCWGDSSSSSLEDDWGPFDDYLASEQAEGIHLAFVGAFPSHIYKQWGKPDEHGEISTGYFSMIILEVDPPK